jgi:hypothetical protein
VPGPLARLQDLQLLTELSPQARRAAFPGSDSWALRLWLALERDGGGAEPAPEPWDAMYVAPPAPEPWRCLVRPVKEGDEAALVAFGLQVRNDQTLGQLQPFLAVFPQECMGRLASSGPTERVSRVQGLSEVSRASYGPYDWASLAIGGRVIQTPLTILY